MSEEQQRRELERRASVASVQEVAGKEGFRTFLIDCSRKQSNSYKASLRGKPPPAQTRSSWLNKANGFTVKRGDQVSIEAVAINSNGAAANTVELNPNNIQGKKYCGTKVILSIGFALGNTGRYNVTLPMKSPSCCVNQAVPATRDWISSRLPSPNDTVLGGGTSLTAMSKYEQLSKQGIIPVCNNYGAGAAFVNTIAPNMSNFYTGSFGMVSSASWGWAGYSRYFYNNDGGYSLFRNCYYQGVAGKQKMGVTGNFNQANPAFVDGDAMGAWAVPPPPIPADALAPPTNPINNAAIAAGNNGQMWSGRNPASGNDGLQYILMRNDYQPLMGRPPNSGTYGADATGVGIVAQGDPVVEYPVNPNTGRNEPPRPRPLTAFVVVDLEDVEFIDVNLLATRFTEAFHQTNNSYRWDYQGDLENVANPSGEDEKPSFAVPYGNKFGCALTQSPATSVPLELAEIWDGVFPTFTGSTYKSIPANMWLGSNMEISSPDKLSYRENYKTDWLWAGSGIGNSYAEPVASENEFLTPDLSNPVATTEGQNVGRTGQPYLWNNMIYGNMAVRDFDRWELMYHFFHGDINNLNNTTASAGLKVADLNVRRCVILNTKIRSLIISIDNGTVNTPNGDPAPLNFGSQGGTIGQNVDGVAPETNTPVGGMALGDNVPNSNATTNSRNYHEVSCIGSTHNEPDWVEANWSQEYTGNLLYTNMEYTEYNVKRFSELFPKGEIYDGDLFGVVNQRENDGKSFNYLLDIGLANDFQSSCINMNPLRGTAAAVITPSAPFDLAGCPSASFDSQCRSVCITPYMGGSATHPNDDSGWFRGLEGTPNVFPAVFGGAWDNQVLPVQDSRFNVGTSIDHMSSTSPSPAQFPYLDRYHTCPHMTFTGCGGDKERAGQGREMGRIKVNTRYWNDWRNDVVWRKDEFNLTTRRPRIGSCDASPETLQYLDDSLSKQYGVMCIPYRYWKEDTTVPEGVSVAFVGIAFRVSERYFPEGDGNLGTPVELGTALKPYHIQGENLKTLKLGRIEYGNFFGISNSFMDNPAILPMNSDDQRKTFYSGRTLAPFFAMPQDIAYNYQNYINVGASNATCNFNSDKARFEFTYFYTPTTLSAAYIGANDIGSAGVPQGGTEIATVNQESGTKFFQSQIGENSTSAIDRPKDCIGLNDAFAGIYIDEVYLVPAETEIQDVAVLNNYIQRDNLYATETNFQNITKNWIKASEENWEGCLLDRMGFEYFDIFPPYGSNKNRFSEYSYASTEPKICNQSKKPCLINSKATVSNSLFMDVYWNSQLDPAAGGTDADLYGLPLYGLGANGFVGVNQIAESAALQAKQLPTLFDTAYYLIATSGIVEPSSWYGLNGVLQKTIFYCLKNYASSDMFYGYASTYSLTAEIDHPVGTILTEIRRPDTGQLVPLGENSSVIYKIQRKFEIPPIVTNADGEPIGEESKQPEPKDTQLLEKIVSLLSLQVGEKAGYSEIIPSGVGSGGGGRQEGITTPANLDHPIIPQITANLGGGGVAEGLAARQNVNFGLEAIDEEVMRLAPQARQRLIEDKLDDEGVFPEGMEMFQYPDEGQTRMGGRMGRDLPALPEIPPPFLEDAFADAGVPQNEIFAGQIERLNQAQQEADARQNVMDTAPAMEGTGFIRDAQGNFVPAQEGERPAIPPFAETARRMRLLQTDRDNPFNPNLTAYLEEVGNPERGAGAVEMEWRRDEEGNVVRANLPDGGDGGVLDPVQRIELTMDIMKHIVKTRLATLMTRGGAEPETDAITKSIVQVLTGSYQGVMRAVDIIGSQPDAQFYDELYGVLTEITPQYPAFFSATTGRKLTSSTEPQALEVGGNAVAISDEALEGIVVRAMEGMTVAAERSYRLGGRPMADLEGGAGYAMRGGKMRPTELSDVAHTLRSALDPLVIEYADRDQMRSIERPEGWSGAFSENPDVLWALGDPRIPFGSASSNITESQSALMGSPEGRAFLERGEGIGEETGRGERGSRAAARDLREALESEFRQTTPFARRTGQPTRTPEQQSQLIEEARRTGERPNLKAESRTESKAEEKKE